MLRLRKNASVFLLLVSLLCFLYSGVLLKERHFGSNLAFETPPQAAELKSNQSDKVPKPKSLLISSLGLNLPVLEAKLDGEQWPTTTSGVSWLVDSPTPGQKGNSIIYGHNYPHLLGKLSNLRPGEQVEVKLSNGLTEKFIVTRIFRVAPTNSAVLKSTNHSELTIFTCTGFLDSQRLIVKAIRT